MSLIEHCGACGDPTASLHDTDAGQQVCPDCYTMTLKVERDAARKQLRGAVSREHAVQAIGWLSAEVVVHGAPSLGPEWLELWERALTATGGQ
jgi:hypothetical protein